MGNWSYRINEIQTEENSSYDMAQDRDVINLLFCFSQVDEKSEDWKKLTDKAEQFIWQDGEVRKGRAERIERVLNSWATGKNSPLRGSNIEKPNVARFSAPAYLFNGYNAMKQYFASIGVNLEESLPNLKPETKECAGKVAEAAASTESLELPTGKEEKRALRDYISGQYKRAFYYGAEPGAKMKPVDTYLNEKGPVKVVLNRLDEASRKEIRTISDAYESIKNTKKWYGKDDESYTSMMTAVREYTEAQKQREGSAASADEKKKLEAAMRACKRYVEEKDGVKFTSVGAKRLEAAKEMLDLMNGLPESRQAKVNMAKEKALKEAAEKRAKEKALKEAAEKRAKEDALKEETEKRAKEKTAQESSKTVKQAPKKPAVPKSAGPADKPDEWFRMTAEVMRMEKALADSVNAKLGNAQQEFSRMDRVMEQYKSMTSRDQARVRDMWVNQYEMGEDTWKVLKDRHGIKERVATSFRDLDKEEQKENPKMSRSSQNVVKEAEKKAIQKNKGSKSL